MPQHVRVVDYNPQWPKLFAAEAVLIQSILEDCLVAIHHIGSTAVEGLCAKPIIDIMPVVRELRTVDLLRGRFIESGYEYLGEFGMPGRRYLRKGGDERTHQVHIFEQGNSKDINRHLAVRDYLRCHREALVAYGNLKKTLARQYPYDIEAYCDGKDAFVKSLEQAALQWIIDGNP